MSGDFYECDMTGNESGELHYQKALLRKTMSMELRKHAHLQQDSIPICKALARWMAENPGCKTIGVFSCLPGEPDLSELVAYYPKRRWAYPKITGLRKHYMRFHLVKKPAKELKPGSFRILEPSDSCEKIPITEIDAFFCPGLAFDTNGGRLGRGRGFYDRMLSQAREGVKKIGVCFPWQIVPDTFVEAHDVHMDALISG